MLKCVHGPGSPIDVLIGAMAGADLFETEYPLELALKGKALMLKNPTINSEVQEQTMITQYTYDDQDDKTDLFLALATSLDRYTENIFDVKEMGESKAEKWENPAGPLLEGCECYTCKTLTRSYLYHLFDVKEMNGNILLAIHNAHVYDKHLFGPLKGKVDRKEMARLVFNMTSQSFTETN